MRAALPLIAALLTLTVLPTYGAQEWSFASTGGGSIAQVEGGVALTGPNEGGGANTATITAVAQEQGTYSALWRFDTTDSAYFDRPFFTINGVQTFLATADATQHLEGSILIELQPGDVYGWGVHATDSCCGAGILTITDPTWQPSPTPSEYPSSEPTPTPTPSPTPVESITPVPSVEPVPSVTPSPEPIPESPTEAAIEAVGEAVEALTTLGNDLSPAEKERAAPVAVAVVISQVASAAVAAASAAATSGTGSAGGTGRKGKAK